MYKTREKRGATAYERLKSDILENRLEPGFQATEPEFAERLSMSRTPVHEALVRLDSEGLIEVIPRHGARVLPVSASDMEEIYEILTAIEPEAAARLAAAKLDPGEFRELEQATADMFDALDNDDLEAWADADDRFHRHLLEMHGNRRLCDLASNMFDQAHRARMVTLKMRAPPVRSTKDHEDILSCLKSGDAEGARTVFRKHRLNAAKELLQILESFENEDQEGSGKTKDIPPGQSVADG